MRFTLTTRDGLIRSFDGRWVRFDCQLDLILGTQKTRLIKASLKWAEKQRKEAQELSSTRRSSISPASKGNYSAFLEDDVVPPPSAAEEREKYFMKQLQMGEALLAEGPSAFEASAACFYRALKVFPDVSWLVSWVRAQNSPFVN